MDGGDFDFLLRQPGGNLIGAVPFQRHGEDAPDDGGSFLVHNPVLPLLVPQVAVNDGSGHVLAAHALGLEHGFYLPAGITGIKLIHDVQKRGEVIFPILAIHAVIDGNEADTALTKDFHDLADFEIVPPQTAHVLDDDRLHVPSLDFLHHGGEAGAVKAGSRDTIVREVGRIRKTIPASIVL